MTDSVEEIESLRRRIADLRAGLRRVRQRRLEDGDWAVIDAMLSEAIDQAESGTIEPTDEEDGALPSGEEST